MLTIGLFMIAVWLLVVVFLIVAICALGYDLLRRIDRGVKGLSGPNPDKAAASLAGTVTGMFLGYLTSRKRR